MYIRSQLRRPHLGTARVKAPGSLNSTPFLPLNSSARFTLFPGLFQIPPPTEWASPTQKEGLKVRVQGQGRNSGVGVPLRAEQPCLSCGACAALHLAEVPPLSETPVAPFLRPPATLHPPSFKVALFLLRANCDHRKKERRPLCHKRLSKQGELQERSGTEGQEEALDNTEGDAGHS